MKMYFKFLTKAVFLLLIVIVVNNCAEDLLTQPDNTYQGEDLVLFKPVRNTVDKRANATDAPRAISPEVQLISSKGLLDKDITINYAVDDSSTAVLNTDYNLVSSSPLTIKAGKASTKLDIEVTADALLAGESRVLYITLKGSTDVKPSENYKTYELIIRGSD